MTALLARFTALAGEVERRSRAFNDGAQIILYPPTIEFEEWGIEVNGIGGGSGGFSYGQTLDEAAANLLPKIKEGHPVTDDIDRILANAPTPNVSPESRQRAHALLQRLDQQRAREHEAQRRGIPIIRVHDQAPEDDETASREGSGYIVIEHRQASFNE